ncbi:hypothetical protein X763_07420 [Mesorhizobium sp. LSHC432A00]|nr:hypothetical protein X766_30280 [Mesorhizobium sp. LSJC255A00]ESX33811.1 hypothetical protein X764_29195 [Mesorhizobium sp. LSHC440A00]ESX40126.1 hypothetical protein X763_07420 [Mesorhizobium sp. LSHC432A00]ESX86555.1 hypothetical protein X756_17885 [Mesorhizobium sp. LSHC412B00]
MLNDFGSGIGRDVPMSTVRKLAAIRRQLAQIAALVAEIETEFEDRSSGDWVETAVAAEALGQKIGKVSAGASAADGKPR